MSNYVQTVTGRIPAAELGHTLMHEHVLCDLRQPATRDTPQSWPELTFETRFEIDYHSNRHQPNMLFDDDAIAARELAHFAEAGGGSIVELSVGGLRPQPQRLAAIAESTGVHIVMGAGYYVDAYMPPEIKQTDIDGWQSLLSEQLREGAWGTAIKAGLIGEIGCSWPLEPSERRLLLAAARVQRLNGVAITIHPGRHPDAPAEIADILEAENATPERIIIGHMDRTIFDKERLLALLARGFVLEWDFFGIETSQYWMEGVDLDLPTDYMRLDLIHDLIGRGYGAQIAISHDICTQTRLRSFGGHGYGHILINIMPMMRRRGWRDAEIEQLLVTNPARWLCYLTDGEP